MRKKIYIPLAVACLTLVALACQALSGGPVATATEVMVQNTIAPVDTDVPLPTQTEEPLFSFGEIFEDDFTAGGRTSWGTGTDTESSVEYIDDGLNMQLFTENYIVWSTPNETEYEDVHMEVTVYNNGSDSDTAFGFLCNQQYPITDTRYYFAVTPGGEYAIGKSALAIDDVILSNNGEWGTSDLIAKDAASYRLGADCGKGMLTLYVDGQQIATASDSDNTSGRVALFLWSGEDISTVNVTFDDFVMTKLQ